MIIYMSNLIHYEVTHQIAESAEALAKTELGFALAQETFQRTRLKPSFDPLSLEERWNGIGQCIESNAHVEWVVVA